MCGSSVSVSLPLDPAVFVLIKSASIFSGDSEAVSTIMMGCGVWGVGWQNELQIRSQFIMQILDITLRLHETSVSIQIPPNCPHL